VKDEAIPHVYRTAECLGQLMRIPHHEPLYTSHVRQTLIAGHQPTSALSAAGDDCVVRFGFGNARGNHHELGTDLLTQAPQKLEAAPATRSSGRVAVFSQPMKFPQDFFRDEKLRIGYGKPEEFSDPPVDQRAGIEDEGEPGPLRTETHDLHQLATPAAHQRCPDQHGQQSNSRGDQLPRGARQERQRPGQQQPEHSTGEGTDPASDQRIDRQRTQARPDRVREIEQKIWRHEKAERGEDRGEKELCHRNQFRTSGEESAERPAQERTNRETSISEETAERPPSPFRTHAPAVSWGASTRPTSRLRFGRLS
jgi:hypothetical protein